MAGDRSTRPVTLDRRSFLRRSLGAAGLLAAPTALTGCALPFTSKSETAEFPVQSPEEALQRLIEGNERFANNKPKPINESETRREAIVARQNPFAMIFSCVDSRVPPELIFDRGLGDLFVIRTAGQVVDHAVMGSLEYGAYELEIPLLMVLGHKKCGAVKATVAAIEEGEEVGGEIGYLVEALRPAVTGEGGEGSTEMALTGEAAAEPAAVAATPDTALDTAETTPGDTTGEEASAEDTVAEDGAGDGTGDTEAASKKEAEAPDALTEAIIRNVEMVAKKVSESALISERVKKDRLRVVGAVYDLESGLIELTYNIPEQFLGGAPAETAESTPETEA